jgi:RimJ/RimL family protein N-acetyltransferase
MIFAETERLILRALRQDELPRLTKLIGVWDVARWLSVLPFPYKQTDAEEFYGEIEPFYASGEPQFFAMALKSDGLLIGGVGLHKPRISNPIEGEVEIGYWLGQDFWGKGLMSEATRSIVATGFKRATTKAIGATTSLENKASQKILQKIGLRNLGIFKRDYNTLRGGDQIIKWLLTREEYEKSR